MKALSLWQPWATLWAEGVAKRYETRHWSTTYRGWLLVHAALKRSRRDDAHPLIDQHFAAEGIRGARFDELPHSALIGVVQLVDVIPTDTLTKQGLVPAGSMEDACGDFSAGRFGWMAVRARQFKTPISYKGRQGLFDVPDAVVADALKEAGFRHG